MADPFARQPLGRTGVCVSGLGFGTMGVGGQYTYVVTAVDRTGNESRPSTAVAPGLPKPGE